MFIRTCMYASSCMFQCIYIHQYVRAYIEVMMADDDEVVTCMMY